MTYPVDIDYPFNAAAQVEHLHGLDKLTAIEDRATAQMLYDLHQALDEKHRRKMGHRPPPDRSYVDGKQRAAGDRQL